MKEKKLTLITPKELTRITLETKQGKLKTHTGILIKEKGNLRKKKSLKRRR